MKKILLVVSLAFFAMTAGSKAQSSYNFFTSMSLGYHGGIAAQAALGMEYKNFDFETCYSFSRTIGYEVKNRYTTEKNYVCGVGIGIKAAYNLLLGKSFELSPYALFSTITYDADRKFTTFFEIGAGLELAKKINEYNTIFINGGYSRFFDEFYTRYEPSIFAGMRFKIH